ncbi:hypothetical protein [Shewanella algidipiscicola]|uniref:hypothetical protein n=1 Tax=Shewanella algidipiscicola TaxID=614070 RepID=UPI0013A539F8|nr:hypothetical protein [Shewanella algidipiscicola]
MLANVSQLIALVIFSIFITGCEKESTLVPLTDTELLALSLLQVEQDQFIFRNENYDAELLRLSKLNFNYGEKFLEVSHRLEKINKFDDGKFRLCDFWSIKNTGSELVEQYEVNYFYYDDNGRLLGKWDSSLIYANDTLSDSDATNLIYALAGKQYPLKANEIRRYDKNKNCHKESFAGWDVKNVTIKVTNLKLRAAVDQMDQLAHMKWMLESGYLELNARAKENKQLLEKTTTN